MRWHWRLASCILVFLCLVHALCNKLETEKRGPAQDVLQASPPYQEQGLQPLGALLALERLLRPQELYRMGHPESQGRTGPLPPREEQGLQQLGALLALQHLDAAAHAAHKALLRISGPGALLLRHAGQVCHVLVQGITQRLDLQYLLDDKQPQLRCCQMICSS